MVRLTPVEFFGLGKKRAGIDSTFNISYDTCTWKWDFFHQIQCRPLVSAVPDHLPVIALNIKFIAPGRISLVFFKVWGLGLLDWSVLLDWLSSCSLKDSRHISMSTGKMRQYIKIGICSTPLGGLHLASGKMTYCYSWVQNSLHFQRHPSATSCSSLPVNPS